MDAVNNFLSEQSWTPNLRFISGYHDNDNYIDSISKSVEDSFSKNGRPDKLIFSYHGMPERYLHEGDPYFCFCHKTTRLVAEKLRLDEDDYEMAFQSRFGYEKWLQPYTDKTLESLPKEGKKNVLAICPGFSSDCVETLEEIQIQGKESFLESGGENFDMVPCLNDNEDHIILLKSFLLNSTGIICFVFAFELYLA